jgi:hypothetical protein
MLRLREVRVHTWTAIGGDVGERGYAGQMLPRDDTAPPETGVLAEDPYADLVWDPDEFAPPPDFDGDGFTPPPDGGRSLRSPSRHAAAGGTATPLPTSVRRDFTGSEALAVLLEVYGYDTFRGEQADIVSHVVAGGDAVVTAFSSQNGEAQLRNHFTEVTRSDLRPRAVFPDRGTALAYLRSSDEPVDWQLTADGWPREYAGEVTIFRCR